MSGYALVPAARKDLAGLLDHIAGDDVDAALRVHDRFVEIFEMLAEHPDAGHFRDDLTSRPVRFFPVYAYLVVYSAGSNPVEIVRILHGAQDVESRLR